MSEDNIQLEHIQNCPTEVLLYIFTLLKPAHLIKCRRVCWRWRLIIDGLCRSEQLWRKHCEIDFKDIFKIAYYKSKSELSWHSIYRSLCLWPKLNEAVVTRDEFASACLVRDEIRGFQVLRHGEIGVQTRAGIIYYDLKTLKQSNRSIVSGEYRCYAEDDDVVIVLSFTLNLFVVRKTIMSPHHEADGSFQSVKCFLLQKDILYYVTVDNDIYFCRLRDEAIKSSLLIDILDEIICLGYKNGLHVLTFYRDIFTIVDGELVFQCTLNNSPSLHTLNRFNFLEHLDWRIYFQWMLVLNHTVPQGPIRDIIVVKMYGEVVLVGTNSGVFRIYHCPYTNEEFDLFNTVPLRQFNFMERSDCPVLSYTPIIQIDVVEGEDSHTVLVGMPKKIAVLDFTHSVKSATSLPKLTLG